MSTYYASKHGAGVQNTMNAIANRIPFKSGGALSGVEGYGGYTVMSYNEPIAIFNGQLWTVTTRKFSVTTSNHQSLTRRALQPGGFQTTADRL